MCAQNANVVLLQFKVALLCFSLFQAAAMIAVQCWKCTASNVVMTKNTVNKCAEHSNSSGSSSAASSSNCAAPSSSSSAHSSSSGSSASSSSVSSSAASSSSGSSSALGDHLALSVTHPQVTMSEHVFRTVTGAHVVSRVPLTPLPMVPGRRTFCYCLDGSFVPNDLISERPALKRRCINGVSVASRNGGA